jgi:hypothetical protein
MFSPEFPFVLSQFRLERTVFFGINKNIIRSNGVNKKYCAGSGEALARLQGMNKLDPSLELALRA